MKRAFLFSLIIGLTADAVAQRYHEVGLKASRERVSFLDLTRVSALPARAQDLNIGVQTLYHLSKRVALTGSLSYNTNRYFGINNISTNDLPSSAQLMEAQSVEFATGARVTFLNKLPVRPFVAAAIHQNITTVVEYPGNVVIIGRGISDELPALRPRTYGLMFSINPGVRYAVHDYLSLDFEPLFKWAAIGQTSYTDQLVLGWSISLNYRLGK